MGRTDHEQFDHEADASHGQETDAAGHEETRPADDPVDTLAFTRGDRRLRTVIGVCLDASGSMAGVRDATIAAFNAFLVTQAAETADDCDLTLCQFNSIVGVPSALVPVQHVTHLTPANYVPTGSTALYDAVAHVVAHVDREGRGADRVLVVVVTDGQENASRETTKDALRDLIRQKEATGRWTFVYLSAALDAFTDSGVAGFGQGNSVQFAHGGVLRQRDVTLAYANLSDSIATYRAGRATTSTTMSGTPTGADWTATDES